jgi:uncharacterized protein (DUF362 family)
MKNYTVSLIKTGEQSIERTVRTALEYAGGLPDLIRRDSNVIVKPNLNQPAASGSGLVTDARVTEAVTKAVLDCGPGSVKIADGAAAGYDFIGAVSTTEAFRVSGTEEIARRLGVETVNCNADDFVDVTIENPYVMDRVKLSKTVYEADIIISVPVLKTHHRTITTISLKNMKGVMLAEEKRKTHMLGLDPGIADLISVIRPHYTVVDALTVMQGNWEPEDKRKLDLIMAGASPHATDYIGTYLIGFDPEKVMHLTYSLKREGITLTMDSIEIVGESLEENRVFYKTGFDVIRSRYSGIRIIEGKSSCSGCIGQLIGALSNIRAAGYEENLSGVTIVMGSPVEEPLPEEKVLFLGKCSAHYGNKDNSSKGCPPKEETIIKKLGELTDFPVSAVIEQRDRQRKQTWESTKKALRS